MTWLYLGGQVVNSSKLGLDCMLGNERGFRKCPTNHHLAYHGGLGGENTMVGWVGGGRQPTNRIQ